MAVELTGTSTGQGLSSSASSNFSFSHTVAAGNNRLLTVFVWQRGTTTDPSSVTYGGTALSKSSSTSAAADADDPALNLSFWYLQNPAVGTANIQVTSIGNIGRFAYARSFKNIRSIDSFILEGSQIAVSNVTSVSRSITDGLTAAAFSNYVIDALILKEGIVPSATAGQTVDLNAERPTSGQDFQMATGFKTVAGSTTATMSYSWTGAHNACFIAQLIRPAYQTINIPTPSGAIGRFAVFAGLAIDSLGGAVQYMIGTVAAVWSVLSPASASLREVRTTITDFSKLGRFLSIEFSRAGDGPDWELHLVDVDVRFRARRRWRDF